MQVKAGFFLIVNHHLFLPFFSSEAVVGQATVLLPDGTQASHAKDQHPKLHMLIFFSGLHIHLQYLISTLVKRVWWHQKVEKESHYTQSALQVSAVMQENQISPQLFPSQREINT